MGGEGPRLRSVEAFPVEAQGQALIALRDPSGIAERILTVSPLLAPFLAALDGRHTLDDLEVEYARATGRLLARAEVEGLLAILDREHFLDSATSEARKAALTAAYRAAGSRPPVHAGVSYPADPGRLAAWLAALEREGGAAADGRAAEADGELLAIVAPHIDLRVGGAVYVPAYRALTAAGGADLPVVLGVAHGGLPGHFAAASLDFATPLGVARTDREFVAALSAAFGEDLTAEELAHRMDHTVEFQVVFLQWALSPACRVVGLLCSFGHRDAADAQVGARIARFASGLAATIAARRAAGERVVLVASADLAHVGPRYGDPVPFDDAALREVERADRALLEAVAAADPAALLARIAGADNAHRICGFSPLYVTLAAAGARGGRLLAYGQGPTDGAGSVCSYASLALYR